MRIDSKPPIAKTTAKMRTSRARRPQGSSDFSESIGSTNAGGDSVVATEQIVPLDSLLSVQQIDSQNLHDGQRNWVRRWGNEILEHLSQLREGLLTGNMPPERLARLQHSLDQRKQDITDQHLRQIVDEIELRARIEIAKIARDQSQHQRDA